MNTRGQVQLTVKNWKTEKIKIKIDSGLGSVMGWPTTTTHSPPNNFLSGEVQGTVLNQS